jgi:hypothetical protein
VCGVWCVLVFAAAVAAVAVAAGEANVSRLTHLPLQMSRDLDAPWSAVAHFVLCCVYVGCVVC